MLRPRKVKKFLFFLACAKSEIEFFTLDKAMQAAVAGQEIQEVLGGLAWHMRRGKLCVSGPEKRKKKSNSQKAFEKVRLAGCPP